VSRPVDRAAPAESPQEPPGQSRTSFLADLRSVLAERGFRQLFACRLTSQTGDGLFTAGLGTYVFFNNTSFPSPARAAAAFAVLYLPYSFIGPFAGVFIDRWSRRQILVWSPLLRTVFVAGCAALVWSGNLGVWLGAGALLVLGVNRFFLSALSAALPHVVPRDKLVMGNSVAPTAGTIMTSIGLIGGTLVHLLTGGGRGGSAITLLCGGLLYVAAGLAATRMHRNLLGPTLEPGTAAMTGLLGDFVKIATGLVAGAKHLARRRRAGAALFATGFHRFCYGILLLMSILLYRNYFYAHSSANASLKHYLVLGLLSAIGYGSAAVVTPVATRWMSPAAWVTALLAGGGIATWLLTVGFHQLGFVILGFVLGLVAQGITIATTTIIQHEVDDGFLGRVFSLNDMVYNSTFVLGAIVSAVFMPISGRSYAMVGVAAIGYLLAAVGFPLLGGRQTPGGAPGPVSPSPSAQRSSS
jgi:MFS family permease